MSPTTADDLDRTFDGPAVFANCATLTLTPQTGRLTFMEAQPGTKKARFRASVAMAREDLINLKNLLVQMLDAKAPPSPAAKN